MRHSKRKRGSRTDMGMLPPGVAGPPENPVAVAATPANRQRIDFTPGRFTLWMGALAILWLILAGLADSGNADAARALAALVVVGAVMALGPGAIGNAKGLVEGSL